MPAERTQRRAEQEDNQFVWSLEPTNPVEFACSADLSDLPPLVDAPAPGEFILFSPTDNSPPSPRKQRHSKKKPENHIPRPPNAFILFRSSFIKSQAVSTEVETNHSTLSTIIGLTWQNLPDVERKVWHTKAKEALEEHKRKFPKYAFRPVQNKAKGGTEKRKVREVEPKDPTRCAKIAQLLVEGKKGHELDLAIQEFDKQHIPQIVARFEAPITACSYRRSSSAPIPDTEHARASQGFLRAPSTPRKSKSQRSLSVRLSTPQPTATYNNQLANADASFTSGVDDITYPSLKREPSFDFSTFSFDNASSPLMSSFEPCDPLTMASVSPFDQPCQSSLEHYSSNLSIDTNWRSASPVSNTDFLDSPLCAPTPSPSFDSFNPFAATPMHATGMEKPFFDYTHYPMCHQPGVGNIHESHLAAHMNPNVISPFDLHHHSSIPMVDLDLDFGSFMSTPQY